MSANIDIFVDLFKEKTGTSEKYAISVWYSLSSEAIAEPVIAAERKARELEQLLMEQKRIF